MKIFIFKTLFVFILIYILFQLTIGLTIKKIKEEIYNFKSKENIELIKKKLRSELEASIKKDKILDKDDVELFNKFLKKLNNELQSK
jgi:DNA-binding transcriptional MerR regulator